MNPAYQVTGFAYQGIGQFAYQGSVDVTTTGRTRLRRLKIPLFKVEDEAAKVARRLREASEGLPEPRTEPDLSGYYRESTRLALAISAARSEASAARLEIAELQAKAAKAAAAQQSRLEHQRLLAEQRLVLAAVQEAIFIEEMEVVDVAFIAAVVTLH